MKINIQFNIIKDQIRIVPDTGGHYGTDANAKKNIRAKVEEKIASALEIMEKYQTAFIFCGDGTVFHVFFRGRWGYAIVRKGQESISHTYTNAETFQECMLCAKEHANDYDGVVSVSR